MIVACLPCLMHLLVFLKYHDRRRSSTLGPETAGPRCASAAVRTRGRGEVMSARGFIAGAVAVGAFGYAATHLALALTLPPPQEAELARLAPAEVAEEAPAAPAAPWPAVFGTTPPPAPEAPAPAEPEITTAYSLKGLVADAGGGWAIIDDGSGER